MKIGDKVKISPDSMFFNDYDEQNKTQGQHGIGTILLIRGDWYSVKFNDKYENVYEEHDLISLS